MTRQITPMQEPAKAPGLVICHSELMKPYIMSSQKLRIRGIVTSSYGIPVPEHLGRVNQPSGHYQEMPILTEIWHELSPPMLIEEPEPIEPIDSVVALGISDIVIEALADIAEDAMDMFD